MLDLAAGRGTSALHLARVFDCHVTGVDYSGISVAQASEETQRQGLSERVDFVEGDAEQLQTLADESFDAVLCECAYSTFPNKQTAAAEIPRVLTPGGRFGLSHLTANGALALELHGLIAWMACIADAPPVARYVAGLEAVGLRVSHIEAHNEALTELIGQARGRLLGADVVAKIQQAELPGVDLQLAKRIARSATEAVNAGTFGYALIIATRGIPLFEG